MKRALPLLAALRVHGSTLLELLAIAIIAGSVAALAGDAVGALVIGVYLLIVAVLNGRADRS